MTSFTKKNIAPSFDLPSVVILKIARFGFWGLTVKLEIHDNLLFWSSIENVFCILPLDFRSNVLIIFSTRV